MTDNSESTERPTGFNRRTLIKAGAHAAWAVPAIQIVAASPAFAASGCHITIVAQWVAGTKTLTLTINNTGGAAASFSITAAARNGGGNVVASTVGSNSAGWSRSSSNDIHTFSRATLPEGTSPLVITFSSVANSAATISGQGSGTVGGSACPATYSQNV